MIMLFGQRVDLILILALVLILTAVVYGLILLVLSRFEPQRSPTGPTARSTAENYRYAAGMEHHSPFVVFVLPCLNEEQVIAASLARLTALDHPRIRIVVVDDGSDDATAAIVADNPDPRIVLIQRVLPHARQGKGEALNTAIRHIRSGTVLGQYDPAEVVVCVMDADGHLEDHTLEKVLPLFIDPDLGAVQIGVRINNRHTNMLARMQDVEFVLYTHIFQRGRRHLGSVGLGGNGQFVRMSALDTLGSHPWSRSLSEDLDLGVRLLLQGWDTEFCSTTAVHQQGLVDLRAWLKQRTRWFQGHLQTWPLVPWVLRNLRGTRRLDVLYHLTSPFLLLVGSLLTVAFGLWTLSLAVAAAAGSLSFSPWWVSAYLVAFGPVLLYGLVYARRESSTPIGRWRALLVFHAFALYATLWYVAGWRAAVRALIGRQWWVKTERSREDQIRPVPAS